MATQAMRVRRSVPWPIVLIAAPPVLAFVVVAVFLAAEVVGVHPWARPPAITVSEAAALGAAYQAVQLIRQGQDPSAAAQVRPGLVERSGYVVTPIDGAILGRRPEMISVLKAHGARVTDAARSVCLANAVGVPDAVPLLVEGGAAASAVTAGSRLDAVEALALCGSLR